MECRAYRRGARGKDGDGEGREQGEDWFHSGTGSVARSGFADKAVHPSFDGILTASDARPALATV